MQTLTVQPGGLLRGEVQIPGDKSITHRALIIGALAKSKRKIILQNWLQSLDCMATMQALVAMGVQFCRMPDSSLQIVSVGLDGLQAPANILNVGNSGTAIRLLTGVLAAQKFNSVITGDASICSRPMRRIILPLRQMGAQLSAVDDQYAPLSINGGQKLRAINYAMPMASAQVKSALLLAGLYAIGQTSITSPSICRDHTEILLQYMQSVVTAQEVICLNIPGDISSAAFFIVAAAIAPGSHIIMRNIGLNPTRAAILTILRAMGAEIRVTAQTILHGELRADLQVLYKQQLQGIEVPMDLVANAIDEIPILCLAAACARGTTTIRGAQELRYKESDRIAMLAKGLRNLGIQVNEFADGMAIQGGLVSGGIVASGGDHRIAMTFAMAGLVAKQPIIVQDTGSIATSFPGFAQIAAQAGLLVKELECPV